MAQETEIKLRIRDLQAFRRALRRLGTPSDSSKVKRVHEWNELFDTPSSELKRRGELLRIRTESPRKSSGGGPGTRGQRTIVTLKRPAQGTPSSRSRYKVKEEIETEVRDARVLADVLESLGMRVWFRYEKYRTTFRLPASIRWAQDLLIELDETPIGSFVELEGPRRAIDQAAKALGYGKPDYVTANYFVLYREHCRQTGKKLGDMLFKSSRR